MVSTVNKKGSSNIRAPNAHSPVLVSPISVAHRNNILEADGAKKNANWMRDQWVANLKKKRTGGSGSSSNGTCSPPSDAAAAKHATIGKTKTTSAAISINASIPAEKDSMMMHPAMFFNDLGCFEIESQSFTRVEASSKASTNKTSSTKSNSSSSASKSAEGGGKTKKNMKPLVKKRSNCAALDPNQPKPRTPRRKLNCGNAFEDLDLANFSSVGTPSNFNAEVHHMWGHELDFAGSYVDTFLDLPTPKSAEMPTIGVLPYNAARELEQPKLIRTNSIEQEGLSHFFEQTHLGSSSSYPPTKATTLLKPNKTIKNKSKNTKSTTASVGIMEAVDQVFGSTTSTTTGASTSTNATSTTTTTGGRKNSSGTTATKRSKATTKSKKANVAASKGGDFNFDHKNMPEFESLLEEYKLADIDQDLDSFYMDTLESFGGELDLISA